jgi:hypothetical protein
VAKGEEIRKLKADKADKAALEVHTWLAYMNQRRRNHSAEMRMGSGCIMQLFRTLRGCKGCQI